MNADSGIQVNLRFRNPIFGNCSVFEANCLFFLPLIPVFRVNGRFQAHVPYVARNSCRRAMYKSINPQAKTAG